MNDSGRDFYRLGFWVALVACAFLAGRLQGGANRAVAQDDVSTVAGDGGRGGVAADGNRDMIAVTGTSSTGAAVLYLVDTRQKRLCVYQGSGKNIELVAARNIEYDLKLDAYRDSSEAEVQVRLLRKRWLDQHGSPVNQPANKAADKNGASGD